MKDREKVSLILDLAEILLMSGAEISRVEDTTERISRAYGFEHINIFCIPSSIVLTLDTKQERVTETRRIKSVVINMQKIAEVNQCSREICNGTLSVEEVKERIASIRAMKELSLPQLVLVYFFAAFSFSVFFGGTLLDALVSGCIGIGVLFLLEGCTKADLNPFVRTFMTSFLTGACTILATKCWSFLNTDKIIIGCVMLLIPGLAMTTSLRDLIQQETISGLLSLAESLLKAFAIAVGFSLAFALLGGLV